MILYEYGLVIGKLLEELFKFIFNLTGGYIIILSLFYVVVMLMYYFDFIKEVLKS